MRAFFEPYHVRLDMLPGESNLDKDGIPRVFDGRPDEPTYRYFRGDENNPDKSEQIQPGVPSLLEFAELDIQPIVLPTEAWQPERQPWVLQTHIDAAKQRLDAAHAKAEKVDAGDSLSQAEVELAQAELASVQRRADATRAAWSSANEHALESANQQAIRTQRLAAVAKAKLAVVKAELALSNAKSDQTEAAQKALATATEQFNKASEVAESDVNPTDKFTPLIGAKWTPTRFEFSGKDDAIVEFIETSTGRRTALADWITDRRNPLTARVAANHIWMRHMGTPLVSTVFDFGRNGKRPSHPKLLDWLASELMDNHWNMKHLHRLIITSNAYRMQSTVVGGEQNIAIDPDNRYLWRRSPTRVESQVIRDSLLSLAGKLTWRIGGPSVLPGEQAASTRRSLYFFHSNNQRNQFLTTFDEARSRTVIAASKVLYRNRRWRSPTVHWRWNRRLKSQHSLRQTMILSSSKTPLCCCSQSVQTMPRLPPAKQRSKLGKGPKNEPGQI